MKVLHLLILSACFVHMGMKEAFAFQKADSTKTEKTLVETITKSVKKNDFLNVKVNTRTSFHTSLTATETDKAAFKVDYIRLEVTGNVTDRIFYKWMQHLNRSNRANSLDHMPASIDCLGIGFNITPTLSTFVGKQYADFGGFEYDSDPALVYEFSDLGNNMTCFLVGAHIQWQCTPTQEVRFQIVNGRNNSAEDTYAVIPADFKPAKLPLGYTFNWNGLFFDNRLATRCSYSIFHEGEKNNVNMLMMGASWMQENFNMYVDATYSFEDIDKLGVFSSMMSTEEAPYCATDCGYLSVVSRINYRPAAKLNLFVKGMYETASIRKNDVLEKGKYRTSFGYQGGVEYFPMKENLRFFAVYHAKQVDMTNRALEMGLSGSNPQHLSVGLIYNIPVF